MTLEPLLQASPAIQIHTAAALVAFGLGAAILFRRKGGRLHKMAGRVWVATMLVVTLSSFFIHTIRMWGLWSPVHLLSIGTTGSLILGVYMIRKRNIASHKRIMQSTYLGALIIAGFFTFMPGRIMHEVLFSGPLTPDPVWTLVAVLVGGVLIFIAVRRQSFLRSVR